MRIKRGITRTVWLIGPWAIKLPSLRYGGAFFIKGMLANLEEAWTWLDENEKGSWKVNGMCPVLFCSWLGFVLVMPRCTELKRNELGLRPTGITTDEKPCNFGWLRVKDPSKFTGYTRRVVCFDYA